jgi:N-acyl-D-aspartate/D-glutamate deacylase
MGLRFMVTFPIIRTMLMKLIRTVLLASVLLWLLAACEGEPLPSADPATQLISNVILIDGTGAPRRKESVRILAGKIIDVGELKARTNDIVIDGGGQVLAPGFIDTHSHADAELFDQPSALAAVSQGITTVLIGQDGGSPLRLFDFRLKLLDQPVAINIAAYSGHNTLRRHVLGENYQREATEPEIAVMSQFLREDMQAGALGLATGLEYDPGIYSSTEEVIELARVAAGYGGRYISHVRSEDRWFEQAIDEIIEIGREAEIPVQVSHIKLAQASLWGRAPEILAKMDAARAEGIDITADIYPYEYSQSAMTAQTGEPADMIIGASMREDDIWALMAWPHTNICTDGSLADLHPRGAGSFPRVLGRYVRELGLLSLEQAVYKMTGLSARHMGFLDRGVIRPGAAADLVLFDPDSVIDNATPQNPGALSSGISKTWVNGQIVFAGGHATGLVPGRFIARASAPTE